MITSKKIILFDGVCGLCNVFVDFVIRFDPQAVFQFAALQSDAAKELSHEKNNLITSSESVILFDGTKLYKKSTAALKILTQLKPPALFKLFHIFWIFPPFIRDFVYDSIAQNRYRIIKKRESCRIPSENEKRRFLS
jgi:predicted DCC family thiol-disulfide oxidoreductase YuxK